MISIGKPTAMMERKTLKTSESVPLSVEPHRCFFHSSVLFFFSLLCFVVGLPNRESLKAEKKTNTNIEKPL